MKTLACFAFILFFLAAMENVMAADISSATTPSLKRGSSKSALLNRSTLRKYATQIQDGTITFDELKDYIEKGGAIDQASTYDTWKNFNVGDSNMPLLFFFLDNPPPYKLQKNLNRLDAFKLLLSAGAKPNPALIWACRRDDLKAVRILLSAKADPNVILPTDSDGHSIPPLGITSNTAIAEILFAAGAKFDFYDQTEGSLTTIQTRRGNIEMVRWLMKHGVPSPMNDTPPLTVKDVEGYLHTQIEDAQRREEQLKALRKNDVENQKSLTSAVNEAKRKVEGYKQLIELLNTNR
jgi:hypothetical protein